MTIITRKATFSRCHLTPRGLRVRVISTQLCTMKECNQAPRKGQRFWSQFDVVAKCHVTMPQKSAHTMKEAHANRWIEGVWRDLVPRHLMILKRDGTRSMPPPLLNHLYGSVSDTRQRLLMATEWQTRHKQISSTVRKLRRTLRLTPALCKDTYRTIFRQTCLFSNVA